MLIFWLLSFLYYINQVHSATGWTTPTATTTTNGDASSSFPNGIAFVSKSTRQRPHVILPPPPPPIDDESSLNNINFETEKQHTTKPPRAAIVVMDQFADYHCGYLIHQALHNYNVAVITILSDYLQTYLLTMQKQQHDDVVAQMGIPSQPHEFQQWIDELKQNYGITPSMLSAIICESDSGLENSEQLGVLFNMTQHNGINTARRDKYLMNQQLASFAKQQKQEQDDITIVRQCLCQNRSHAIEYARQELGLKYDGDDDSSLLEPNNNNNEMNTTTSSSFCNGLLGNGVYIPSSSNRRRCCIVKPVRGVASESVHLCHSLEQVGRATDNILNSGIFGATNVSQSGLRHEQVLVQEFLYGTEYALDIVSRNGHHKIVAIWRYDKRPIVTTTKTSTDNTTQHQEEAPFVYYSTELVDKVPKVIYNYARKALDSLDCKWGLSHVEIIATKGGNDTKNEDEIIIPKLVEVNCRQHNMDFVPLCMVALGYNAFDVLLEAYLGKQQDSQNRRHSNENIIPWQDIPDEPGPLRTRAAMVHLVCSVRGRLVGINSEALYEIESMESTMGMEIYPSFLQEGNEILPTVDIKTDAGWIHLVNDNEERFVSDYNRIVQLMPDIFRVE